MRFMVVINMVGDFDDDFMSLVEKDTAYSEQLRAKGVQEEIMMQEDLRRCWSVFNAESRDELQNILEGFPLHDKLQYEVYPLWQEEES